MSKKASESQTLITSAIITAVATIIVSTINGAFSLAVATQNSTTQPLTNTRDLLTETPASFAEEAASSQPGNLEPISSTFYPEINNQSDEMKLRAAIIYLILLAFLISILTLEIQNLRAAQVLAILGIICGFLLSVVTGLNSISSSLRGISIGVALLVFIIPYRLYFHRPGLDLIDILYTGMIGAYMGDLMFLIFCIGYILLGLYSTGLVASQWIKSTKVDWSTTFRTTPTMAYVTFAVIILRLVI